VCDKRFVDPVGRDLGCPVQRCTDAKHRLSPYVESKVFVRELRAILACGWALNQSRQAGIGLHVTDAGQRSRQHHD
jgi:hypothetical protein